MSRLRVLILEDRPEDAELVLAHLRRAGFELESRRVDTETDYLAELTTLPDVIIADYQMPQFTGLRALQLLRERGIDIPFIMMSGTIGEEVAVTAMKEGAADYVMKDRPTRLGQAVRRALEEKALRDAKRAAEESYHDLYEGVPVGLFRSTPDGRFLQVNEAMVRMTGYPDRESLIATGPGALYVNPETRAQSLAFLERGGVNRYEEQLRRRDGTTIWVRGNQRAVRDGEGKVLYYEGTLEDITAERQAAADLARERNLLRTLVDSLPDFISVKDLESRFVLVNEAYTRFAGRQRPEELLGRTVFDVFPPHLASQYVADDQKVIRSGQSHNLESETVDRQNEARWHAVTKVPLRNGAGEIFGLVGIARDVTERKRAEDQITNQLQELSTLYVNAQKLSQSLDQDELSRYVVETVVKVLGGNLAWLGRVESDGSIKILTHSPTDPEFMRSVSLEWVTTSGRPSATAIRRGFPIIVREEEFEQKIPPERVAALRGHGFRSAGAFPLISRDHPFGVLVVFSDRLDFFTGERTEFIQAFMNQAATALENARLFEEAERRLQQLQALRNIDMAITASLDLRVTLNVILDQVTTNLKADAANVLLFDPYSQTLRFAINRGFRSKALQSVNLRLGEGYAGRAALERRVVSVPNLAAEMGEFSRSPRLPDEGFIAYVGIPLVAKGQVKGVLEVFHRAPLHPTLDWLSFLEALAGQAAIAIDNSSLFDNLQRANLDLLMAYDTTLEGWSKALDLRDKETEGHTLRVTHLTVQLARAMGVSDADLVHIRRGALLHDIGKMGIPDSVLLKPGPLTDDEWVVMKKHPVYAYELLSPIPYLRLAMDIPYCHHEKWDGTGYPRRLKGEEIPLAARIFAIIDVYDALTSDRPYRPAWPKEKVIAHIRDQTGKHFDPKVVETFLRLDLPTG